MSNSSEPWKVLGLPGDVADVVLGAWHACALVQSDVSIGGEVYCWGVNFVGQLGQGYTNGTFSKPEGSATPLLVKGLSNTTALYAGKYATCAVMSAQRVACWGDNYGGNLGLGVYDMEQAGGHDAVTIPTTMLRLCA
jgi:alpha-tubulin suppressor-like RCC1 family protein